MDVSGGAIIAMLGSRCKIFDMYWDMIGKLEYMGAWTGVIIGLEWLSMISPCTLTMEHLRSYCIPIDGVKWIHGYVSNCKGNIMGHHRSCFFEEIAACFVGIGWCDNLHQPEHDNHMIDDEEIYSRFLKLFSINQALTSENRPNFAFGTSYFNGPVLFTMVGWVSTTLSHKFRLIYSWLSKRSCS